MQYIRLLLFYSVIFQSVISSPSFSSPSFSSPANSSHPNQTMHFILSSESKPERTGTPFRGPPKTGYSVPGPKMPVSAPELSYRGRREAISNIGITARLRNCFAMVLNPSHIQLCLQAECLWSFQLSRWFRVPWESLNYLGLYS